MSAPQAAAPAQPPGPAASPGPGLLERAQAFRERHETSETALFFVAGLAYDVATVTRIDDGFTLIQQGVFLGVLGFLLALDQRMALRGLSPGGLLGKAWSLRESGIHFLFGSLLSAATLFYFRSASGFSGLLFLLGMFGLLVANELPRFRRLGPVVRLGLYTFALVTFFAYLLPVLFGLLSVWFFVLSTVVTGGLVALLSFGMLRWSGGDRGVALRRGVLPGATVLTLLLVLYFAGAVPPVPLSLRHLGVYHQVEREGAVYRLHHEPTGWRFWHKGDQRFLARPGDRVYVFTRVFAPARFDDKILVRWRYRDDGGAWVGSDAIPLRITGGRDEGYRGYAYKANWRPGRWRVDVETEDGRLLGRIGLTVVEDPRSEERVFEIEEG